MSVTYHEEYNGKVAVVSVSGRLSKEDYHVFVPKLEQAINRFGTIRILFEMQDFHGWQADALWEDIRFDAKHFLHIERLAMVGERKWEKGMSVFCRPFTRAKIKYFDLAEAAKAHDWIAEGIEVPV
ncbi:MAG: STAS/SEC14 domain-containing protein [Phycisphaeraceae bacterium]|nr:STAS/SEC14 domain-containing protein [Phycisphaeraceae bacterium]